MELGGLQPQLRKGTVPVAEALQTSQMSCMVEGMVSRQLSGGELQSSLVYTFPRLWQGGVMGIAARQRQAAIRHGSRKRPILPGKLIRGKRR